MSTFRWVIVILLAVCLLCQTNAAELGLEEGFRQPPSSAKPHTWWHWMNGNISREGITADLEAMKRVGVGGFQAFHVTNRIPPGTITHMSPQWRELMSFAIAEADRLGLEVCLHNCAGWSSSGGPWITPEYSKQKIVWSETQAACPKQLAMKLALPSITKDYYRDITILAFPTPQSERDGKEGFRISDWKGKAGFERNDNIQSDTRPAASGDTIAKSSIINLSQFVDKDGQIKWQVPQGQWTIVRFGHTSTGNTNNPAPDEGRGLESDKLSVEATDLHWKHSVQTIIADVGPLAGKVFNNVLIDSYEAGTQNWTRGFDEQFKKRMGYDMIPFFPALTGRVVEGRDITERFLWDFRRVIADMMSENYFGRFSTLCHQNGMLLSIEPYGDGNFNDYDASDWADIPMGEWWAMRGVAWYHSSSKLAASAAHTHGRTFVGAEAFTARRPAAGFLCHPYLLKSQGDYFFCQGVNRIIFHTFAHQPWVNLKPGMTMGPHGFQNNRNNTWYEQSRAWIDYLSRSQYLLQKGTFQADLCYYAGEDAPQAFTDRWDMTPVPPDGHDYDTCSRSTLMSLAVKNGKLVLPGGMEYQMLVLPDRPMRLDVLEKVRELVQAGAHVLGVKPAQSPSLQNYPACDQQIQKLADEIWGPCDGKTVIEHPFGKGKVYWTNQLKSVLATMGVAPDVEFRPVQIPAKTLYPGNGFESIHRKHNKTDIYFVSNQQEQPQLLEAVFRVQNKTPQLWNPYTGTIEQAPLYHSTKDGRTAVRLRLDRSDSVFVVFAESGAGPLLVDLLHNDKSPFENLSAPAAQPANADWAGADLHIAGNTPVLTAWEPGKYELLYADGKRNKVVIPEVPGPMELNTDWTLAFPEGWGAPAQIALGKLISWDEHPLEDVRHFSGTAVYTKQFDVSEKQMGKNSAVHLDLGDVQVIAEVIVNGKNLGIFWKPPFRIDVSGLLKAQNNQLEIRVTNLWANRLIGDAAYPDTCEWTYTGEKHGNGIKVIPDWLLQGKPRPQTQQKTFATWKFYSSDSPLLKSGLIGPVKLRFAVRNELSMSKLQEK